MRKERLFAAPRRPAAFKAGGSEQVVDTGEAVETFRPYFAGKFGLSADEAVLKDLNWINRRRTLELGERLEAEVERDGDAVKYEISVALADRSQEIKVGADGNAVVDD